MSLTGKVEFLQEIQSPGNVFLEIFGSKKDRLSKICPDEIPIIELLEGNWGDVGCTILVHYFLEGKVLISKENVEAVDKEKQSITYNLLEGDLMELYKTLKVTFQITSKGEKNFLKWIYVYEKLNADVPAPDNLKNFVREVTNKIDVHYLKLKNTCNLDNQACDQINY